MRTRMKMSLNGQRGKERESSNDKNAASIIKGAIQTTDIQNETNKQCQSNYQVQNQKQQQQKETKEQQKIEEKQKEQQEQKQQQSSQEKQNKAYEITRKKIKKQIKKD
ncbi:unnamed protein product (macronuclear) [Paramecium tetraurelia]|uniref:Uncharacterized protein n=1 Tax=Paramecium tetraurelia TaxID=5888 RepID=A0BKH4_PARTE|nr:uncharacterized protein GSPATT00029672001 [Paramecium tetraurelia]CAK59041.1 unnamed protein product [Paramecium tetraurelia]|eukprot:XP_001426439.1 hypothetical protein (macronuclear) [Paramecium tetraurelia strain d4-2]